MIVLQTTLNLEAAKKLLDNMSATNFILVQRIGKKIQVSVESGKKPETSSSRFTVDYHIFYAKVLTGMIINADSIIMSLDEQRTYNSYDKPISTKVH